MAAVILKLVSVLFALSLASVPIIFIYIYIQNFTTASLKVKQNIFIRFYRFVSIQNTHVYAPTHTKISAVVKAFIEIVARGVFSMAKSK